MSVYMCNVSEGEVYADYKATIVELPRTKIKELYHLAI
jgi:hypothetical protein